MRLNAIGRPPTRLRELADERAGPGGTLVDDLGWEPDAAGRRDLHTLQSCVLGGVTRTRRLTAQAASKGVVSQIRNFLRFRCSALRVPAQQ